MSVPSVLKDRWVLYEARDETSAELYGRYFVFSNSGTPAHGSRSWVVIDAGDGSAATFVRLHELKEALTAVDDVMSR